MKKVLFALNSGLARPNGIMTFVRNTVKLLQEEGHLVDCILDSKPSMDFSMFDNVYYDTTNPNYPDVMHNGIPSIVPCPKMTNRIKNTYNNISTQYDIIISNDAQSSEALYSTNMCHHYIHSGPLFSESNAFLTNEYLDYERGVMKKCIVVVPNHNTAKLLNLTDYVVLGLTLNYKDYLCDTNHKRSGILFLGEGSFHKGADVYVAVMKQLMEKAVIISSSFVDEDFIALTNKEIHTFGPEQEEQKIDLIQSTKCMYYPSRTETMSYAVLETLLSTPVYVNPQYPWTANVIELGAISTVRPIQVIANEVDYKPTKIVNYFKNSKKQWINYCK